MDNLKKYEKSTWNRLFYEYIMIAWVTDWEDNAHKLIKLLKWQNCHINLIPYNENPVVNFKESNRDEINKFKDILEKWGLTVTIRDSMWRESKWACGQLWYEKVKWIK
jgi:23S rRNA (adenine2503-C2)-methyltransferase